MIIENEIVTLTDPIKLNNGTVINRFSHVVVGAEIGNDCMIGEHCYVANGAKIGNRVRIQNGNSIWSGVILEDDVFVAPAVSFTNHHNPSDRFDRVGNFKPDETIIGKKATICANCTIVAPKVVGSNSMIGAGSLVLINIPPDVVVHGEIKMYSWARKKSSGNNFIKGYLGYNGYFHDGNPPKREA